MSRKQVLVQKRATDGYVKRAAPDVRTGAAKNRGGKFGKLRKTFRR